MDQDNDRDLYVALGDAVDGVQPTDRLVRIRQETRRRTRRRRAWFATGATGLAVTSIVTIALVNGTSSTPRAVQPAATEETYAVFHVGPGPDGPAAPVATLYRSWVESTSLAAALTVAPADPDYRTLWPTGSLLEISLATGEDEVRVVLADPTPVDRPRDMTAEEARLALQQVAWTAQAGLGTDVPLSFERPDGSDAETVYGLSTDLVGRAPALTVLNHMSIDTPAEGTVVRRDAGPLVVSGRGNSFEASGACFLRGGGVEAGPYLAQMSGWMEPRLFPWELSVELTDVPPGTYTLTCSTDDPTGGTEGRGTDADTRTVIVE